MTVLQIKRGTLADIPTLEEGELYFAKDVGNIYVGKADETNFKFTFAQDVSVYRALLVQSGSGAPVATVLENTLGADIIWTRSNVGDYMGVLSEGDFVNAKNILDVYTSPLEPRNIFLNFSSSYFITLRTYYFSSPDFIIADNRLNNTWVEISVYL